MELAEISQENKEILEQINTAQKQVAAGEKIILVEFALSYLKIEAP